MVHIINNWGCHLFLTGFSLLFVSYQFSFIVHFVFIASWGNEKIISFAGKQGIDAHSSHTFTNPICTVISATVISATVHKFNTRSLLLLSMQYNLHDNKHKLDISVRSYTILSICFYRTYTQYMFAYIKYMFPAYLI